MKELSSVFEVLENDDIASVNIEDEVRINKWINSSIPPSLALVLRKLQQFLHIDAEQIRIQKEWNEKQIMKLSKGESLEKVFVEAEIQTNRLKELDFECKVNAYFNIALT